MKPRLPWLSVLLLAVPGWAAAQTVSLNTGGHDMEITVGEAAVLPADFPQDVVLPQPYVLTRVQRTDAAVVVEFDTPGTPDRIAEEVGARMQLAGWTAAAVGAPSAGLAQAWEKDARAVVLWLAPGVAGVHLQLRLLRRR